MPQGYPAASRRSSTELSGGAGAGAPHHLTDQRPPAATALSSGSTAASRLPSGFSPKLCSMVATIEVVSYAVWSTPTCLRSAGDHQARGSGFRGPTCRRRGGPVPARRRDVVPLAAELVIGDDDQGVLACGPLGDRLQQVDEVVAAVGLAGVAGVLVLRAVGLDEADRRQRAVLGRGDELRLVLQVRPAGLARRVVGEVVERLVVVLEQRASGMTRRPRRPSRRRTSSTRCPAPLSRSPMLGYVGVVDQRDLRAAGAYGGFAGCIGVDREVAAGRPRSCSAVGALLGQLAVVDRSPVGV